MPDIPDTSDRTDRLRQLMQAAGIQSFHALGDRTTLSRRAITTIRQGQAELLKYGDLERLCGILQIPLAQFMHTFSNLPPTGAGSLDDIKAEYQQLQQQLERQRQELRSEFERETIQQLESWLLQWPTAAYAAQNNPAVPARNLVPLLRPVEELLRNWGIEAIGQVGSEVAYDPRLHQLMDADTADTGTPVVVRYVGYRQGEKLLYRARVGQA